MDVQKMLHGEGEFDATRLDPCAFRVRARTMRYLADDLYRDPAATAALT